MAWLDACSWKGSAAWRRVCQLRASAPLAAATCDEWRQRAEQEATECVQAPRIASGVRGVAADLQASARGPRSREACGVRGGGCVVVQQVEGRVRPEQAAVAHDEVFCLQMTKTTIKPHA